MTPMLVSTAIAMVVLLAGQVLLVAGIAAARPHGNIYVTIIGVAVVTAPVVFVLDQWLFGRPLAFEGRVALVFIHLALGGFLFHFMTLPDRSVTLRILAEVELAPGGALSIEALKTRYSVRAMIASRLQQLSQGRLIAIDPDGGLTLETRGLWLARFVTGGRRLFGISSAN